MNAINEQIAYAAGYDAAERNASRAPCHSRVVMGLVANNPDKAMGASLPILAAFGRGYAAQCDAEAARILGEG